jgi:site-specific recombinase
MHSSTSHREAAAFGLLREVQNRVPTTTRRLADTPFLTLPHAAENLTAALRGGADISSITQLKETLFEKIAQCRRAIAEVRARLDTTGVSLSLTYRLEKIDRTLDRMDSLTSMLVIEAKWYTPFSLVFAFDLIEASIEKRTLRDLFGKNLQLLAKKIVENIGNSGENLIAEDKPAWNSMFAKALGGGIVVAPMAILQEFIYAASLAPGITGLMSSVNFIIGFIGMELAGFKLATKQPSMTASTLAARLDQVDKGSLTPENREARIQEFVVLVRNITRSQAASFFGNVMAVIPVCMLFDAAWRYLFGKHFFDTGEALSAVFSVDPFTTPTLLYAAFTGVLLWIASLASGWMENWSVYRGIPAAIASDYRIKNRLGADRAERLSKAFLKRVAPFSGAIALGLLLGVVPQISKFMGIPFSTRHVTLMSGTVTMGWSAAPVDTISSQQSLRSGLGILLIGGLNFGVSFALALFTAFRARGVSLSQFAGLMRAIARAFAARPMGFIFP